MRALGCLILLAACAPAGAEPVATPPALAAPTSDVALMDASEAHARTQAGGILLVDVRTPEEWAATGLATGAKTLMLQDPAFLAKLEALTGGDKSKSIAFICRSGNRSGKAALIAREQGYADVYNVPGGMLTQGGWIEQGLPVVSGGP